ncbi:hypothetical protein [Limnofasciculus baicalensis]|uniref:Uncharacterized protein n=1 Tax=Limnofasciculus baicalensis BBK-W-15 TaxID=2699891 RepID=A0AAE3GY48_9CYAN|nr:hypothetical protein [Limnofasciculus baicalensis]MCP2731988.1 hypothetical protein [Limnofasciculus baicalensis BBK-W-15]
MTDPLINNPDETKSKIRLEYLDGLRGIAALYVVLYHIYNDVSQHFGNVPRFFQTSINLLLAHVKIICCHLYCAFWLLFDVTSCSLY